MSDVKFDGILQHLREEDDGSGSLPVGVTADYTAFEVVANSEAIEAGSTDVVIGGGTVSFGVTISGTTYGTAVQIPAGMEHQMALKALDENGISVSWGDGTLTRYVSAADSTVTASHTYTAPGKYTVKVYGRFARIVPTAGKNLTYRILGFDLPVAAEHASLQGFGKASLRLTEVNFNDQFAQNRFSILYQTFSGCLNLRKVSGMTRLGVLVSCAEMFQDCCNLVSCDFRLPASCISTPGNSDSYRNVFMSSTNNRNFLLTGDLNNFFPQCGFLQDRVDLYRLFCNCWNLVTYANISLTPASAALLAAKLWRAKGKTFLNYGYFDSSNVWHGLFENMPAAARAYIPTAWGGTDSSVAIDPATGTVAESGSYQSSESITFSGGTSPTATLKMHGESPIYIHDSGTQYAGVDVRLGGGLGIYYDTQIRGGYIIANTDGESTCINADNEIIAPAFINTNDYSISGGTATLAVNQSTRYTGSCDRLAITSIADSMSESEIVVTFAGTATNPDIGFPVGCRYAGTLPTYEAGKTYLVSIRNRIAVVAELTTVGAAQ